MECTCFGKVGLIFLVPRRDQTVNLTTHRLFLMVVQGHICDESEKFGATSTLVLSCAEITFTTEVKWVRNHREVGAPRDEKDQEHGMTAYTTLTTESCLADSDCSVGGSVVPR